MIILHDIREIHVYENVESVILRFFPAWHCALLKYRLYNAKLRRIFLLGASYQIKELSVLLVNNSSVLLFFINLFYLLGPTYFHF